MFVEDREFKLNCLSLRKLKWFVERRLLLRVLTWHFGHLLLHTLLPDLIAFALLYLCMCRLRLSEDVWLRFNKRWAAIMLIVNLSIL